MQLHEIYQKLYLKMYYHNVIKFFEKNSNPKHKKQEEVKKIIVIGLF